MPEIRCDVVTEASAAEIRALYEAAGWWTGGAGEEAGIAALIRGSLVFVVATDGGRVVGMGRAISDGVSDAWIQDVTVLPSHRRRGLGAAIVRRVTEACLARGIGWIGLVAEGGSEPLYRGLGFGRMGGTPMRWGIPDVPDAEPRDA